MSEETFQFPSVLHTERLTLTLIDFDNETDVELFRTMLRDAAQELLRLPEPAAIQNAQECIDYYRSYGRIQPKFLGGRKASSAAIWLVRLGADAPQGQCIGAAYMVQRSVCPDQAWLIVPGHRGKGYATESSREVLRYFRDDLQIRDLMAIVHPDSLTSPTVAKKVGYVFTEGGLLFSDMVTKLIVYALPATAPLPKDLVFHRFARVE